MRRRFIYIKKQNYKRESPAGWRGFLPQKNENPPNRRVLTWLSDVSGAVSRVLSLDGHLSRTHVATRLKPPVGTVGQTIAPVGVAADRVYRPPMLPWGAVSSYLAFPPLPAKSRRYFSVALFLGSPPADVIRYPCPVQPGLSSYLAVRDRLRRSRFPVYPKISAPSNQT